MAAHQELPTTVADAMQAYLHHSRSRLSPQTWMAYRQALDLFGEVLRSRLQLPPARTPLQFLHLEWAGAYLEYLQQERSVETEHLYSRALLDFYTYAAAEQWADVDPAALAEVIHRSRRPKQHLIPDPPIDVIERLLTFAAGFPVPSGPDVGEREQLRVLRDKAFLLTLAETGLKVSEMCDLRRRHIDLPARVLCPQPEIALPLSGVTIRAVGHYLEARRSLDGGQSLLLLQDLPLFARHDKRAGKRVLPISRWTGANIVDDWAALALPPDQRHELAASGQTISPQTFRHYFVITTLMHTGDVARTQALARHTDRSTTRRYLEKLQQDEQAANNPTLIDDGHAE